jgi:hypothetical protein
MDTEWGVTIGAADGTNLETEEIQSIVQTLLQRLKESGKNKILIDRSHNYTSKSLTTLYSEASHFQKLGGAGFRVAVIAPNFYNDDNAKFYETVAHNRGFNVKYFPNKEDALQWILL